MDPIHIKVCGLTTVAEALDTIEAGADAIGLNFYTKSPRCIDLATAASICKALPPQTTTVGLFVEPSWPEIIQIAHTLKLQALQLYHPPEKHMNMYPHYATFRVRDAADLTLIQHYVTTHKPAAVLIDAHVEGSMGGTGQVVPWELIEGFDPGVPMILAGGLTPGNVADAIRRVRPWGVDVASGVESTPGRKDPDKVRRFINAVRSV